MNSIAKETVTTLDLKSYKIESDILYITKVVNRLVYEFVRKRVLIFKDINNYIKDESNNCLMQYDKYELAVLYQKLFYCIVLGDYHFLPDYLNQSTFSYFKNFNLRSFNLFLMIEKTEFDFFKNHYYSKESEFYNKFINFDQPLKSFNQQYNINRPVVCTEQIIGIHFLINETNRIISTVTDQNINVDEIDFNRIKENNIELKDLLNYITNEKNALFAKVGLTLKEIDPIINKFTQPSESIKSLSKKIFPIKSKVIHDYNIEEVLENNIVPIPVQKMDDIINVANSKISEINESLNKSSNNNEKLKLNSAANVEFVQNEVRHIVIQSFVNDSLQNNILSNLILFYVIYNLTEVEVFKASLIKYGWIYTLARIGDELFSLASESAEKYMINLLRNTMDTTMMDVVNEESNLSSIRKKLKILEENNSNIDTRILEKEFKSHRDRILRQIFTRLNWIADTITWTIIDNNLLKFRNYNIDKEKLDLLNEVLKTKLMFTIKKFMINSSIGKKDIKDDFNDTLINTYKKFFQIKDMNLNIFVSFIDYCQYKNPLINNRLVLHTALKFINDKYITDKRLIDLSVFYLDEKV
jgi:hypothetical protein